jgi:hypothetical protein
MAQKEKEIANGKDQQIIQHDIEEIDKKVEEVQQLETLIKDQTVASKSFIYVIIALLMYLIFMVIPDIDEKVTWMEKDLSAVLVQSERSFSIHVTFSSISGITIKIKYIRSAIIT